MNSINKHGQSSCGPLQEICLRWASIPNDLPQMWIQLEARPHQRCSPLFAVLRRYIPGAARCCQVLPVASLDWTVLNFLQWLLGHRSGTPDRPRPHSQPSEFGELRWWSGYLQVTKKIKNLCHGQNIQNMVYFPMLRDGHQSIHRIQYTYCKEFLMIGRWPQLIYHAFDGGICKTSVVGISATLFFRQTTDHPWWWDDPGIVLIGDMSTGVFLTQARNPGYFSLTGVKIC